MDILPFKEEFAYEIIDLILPIQQEEFNLPIDISMQPDLKNIPVFYQKANGNFWVALDNNRVIGTIGLIDIGNHEGALRKMFVHRDYRGLKPGAAHLLLKTLLEWSINQQIYVIYLGTREELHAAQRFYEKNNFEEIAKSLLPASFPLMNTDNKFYKYSSLTKK